MADILDQGYPDLVDTQVVTLPGGVLDLALLLGPPVTDIADGNSIFYVGSDGFLHVLVSATSNASGDPLDLTATDTETSNTGTGETEAETTATVELAIVPASPTSTDFKAGDWLTQTLPRANSADVVSLYARLDLSQMGLVRGNYRVYVQITTGSQTLRRRAPGLLRCR